MSAPRTIADYRAETDQLRREAWERANGRTPGTWRYRHKPGEGHRVMTDFHGNGSSFCVTEVNPWQDCQANARLIAAAPDLYDAVNGLIGLLQLVTHRNDVPASLHNDVFGNHRFDAAVAALAKADERSPLGEPVV